LNSEILLCPYKESQQHYTTSFQDQGYLVKHPISHPRNFKVHSSAEFVGRKSLEKMQDSRCIEMYNNKRLMTFLSNMADKQLLYQSKDENG
jgi:hypothetical protein